MSNQFNSLLFYKHKLLTLAKFMLLIYKRPLTVFVKYVIICGSRTKTLEPNEW